MQNHRLDPKASDRQDELGKDAVPGAQLWLHSEVLTSQENTSLKP